ncbi:MAG: cytochrome c [Bacteroidota bacterium]
MRNQLLVILAILAIVFACGRKTDTADGKAIYKRACIVCHGVRGDMGASGAFNLTTSELTLEERINVITNGRNAMAAYKKILKEEEIAAVAEYTLTLKK